MAGFQLPFGVKPVNAVPVDFYSGPYISNTTIQNAIDLANSEIPLGIRFKTMEVRLIVNGIGIKYWYRDGVADINLVEFTTSTSFYLQGGTTYSSDTTSNIYRTGALNIGSNATGSSTAKLYVSSNQPGAFRLEDGTQGPGYLLTSDINGVAGWTSSNSSFYIQGGTTYSFDTTSSIYRTGSLNIGSATAADGRFVVSSTGGTVSLVVDNNGNVYNNSRGSANTLFGYRALYSNTAMGYSNTAFGRLTLYSNTDGSFNTAVGLSSLYSNNGDYNTAVGISSLYYNTIGAYNTAIGAYTLNDNTLGNYNVAMGYNTLSNNTTTVSVLGTFSAGNGYTTGTYSDIQLIYATGSTAITYPSATIVIGVGGTISSVTLSAGNKGTGFKDTTTILTAATSSIGNGTGFTIRVSTILSGSSNTAIGHQSLYTNTSGSENVAIGFNSLFSNSTSSKNVAVGRNTLYYNSTGSNNTAIGYYSSFNNTTGSNNTAIGYYSSFNNTTGSNNTALGNSSLGTNKSGIENIAIGINTLLGTTASSYNTAIGSKALQTLEFGNYNIAIGSNSAFYSTTNILASPQSLTQSSNSVYIGADIRPIENQTNQIVIGYGATGNGSNSVTLGADTITKTILKGNVGIGVETATPTSKLHIETDALGNTTPAISSGIHLENTTPATATIWQNSPSLTLTGAAHSSVGGTSSKVSRFQMFVRTSVNSSGSTELRFESTTNDATIQTPFRLTENGSLILTNVLTAFSGSFNSGVVFSTSINNTTSGNTNGISTTQAFGPTSGTATTNYINIAPTINQTGGANGIIRGVYVNPTLTAAADFRAIEVTNGNVLFSTTSGNVGIGTASPSTKLHIVATQSGAFRLEDGTQSYPGYVLTSDANGVGTWQGNTQITLSGPTATALASWNNTTIMSNFSATCSVTIPATGLPPNFSFRFIVISGNSSSAISFTYSSPVSILPNTILTFAQYESGVIDRYGTGQNYYITY